MSRSSQSKRSSLSVLAKNGGLAGVCLALLCACGKTPEGTADDGIGGASGSASNPNGNGGNGATAHGGAGSGGTGFECSSTEEPGRMVGVPAGAFEMGCSDADAECNDDERPRHTVTLPAFEIDETEVTRGQYAACVAAKACTAPSCAWDCGAPKLPAGCVERTQATAYCTWAGKRLPTEAQWEKAARGTDGRLYPWGGTAPDCSRANFSGCSGHPEAVGTHPEGKSPYGALDMAGNVVEIVSDWYDDAFYAASPAESPTGPPTGTRYVGRGGGYKSEAEWQRASARDWYDTDDSSEPLGFRCAR